MLYNYCSLNSTAKVLKNLQTPSYNNRKSSKKISSTTILIVALPKKFQAPLFQLWHFQKIFKSHYSDCGTSKKFSSTTIPIVALPKKF